MQNFYLPLIITFIFPSFGLSQNLDLKFRHLTIEEGLSHNTVFCISQDNKGFLWIGTDDGLNMYDGYEFKVFKYSSHVPSGLSSNSVYKIHLDSNGKLWFAQSLGIDVYDYQTMTFKHIPLYEGDSAYYTSYTRAIVEDKKGNILIANTRGVYIYDSLKQGFVRFFKEMPYKGVSRQEGIRSMLIDSRDRIWIGSIGNGLMAYDLSTSKLMVGADESAILTLDRRIYSIAESPSGDIWIGTDLGVFIIDPDLTGIKALNMVNRFNTIVKDEVWDIKFESKSRVWIATDGSGLFCYNIDNENICQYYSDENKETSLNNDQIRCINIDAQGILWIGTILGGVNYAQIRNFKKFQLIRNEKGNANSLIYNAVGAIFEDSKGNIWIGTDGKGLDMYDPLTEQFTHYIHDPGNPNSISGSSILTISEDKKGRIWAGGYLIGVNIIDPVTGKIAWIMHDPNNQNSLSNNDVRDILIDDSGWVWILTNGGGLNKYNPEANKFIHYREGRNNSLVDDWCVKLFRDSKGKLWIGTYDGLSIFDPETESFQNFIKTTEPGSISNNWVYSFAEDYRGNIWVGTANGLDYYDQVKKEFIHFSIFNDLPNQVINGLILDDSGNLWISTNAGISKYNPFESSLKHYNTSDGLQGKQFIHGSYFKTREGKIYFGGINGISAFFPDSIRDNTYKPPVYLTDLLINFKSAEIGATDSPLERAISETKKISLSYHQSKFSFRYTALNYINPEKNQYKYKLEGFDKDWNFVGTRREATYTNLVRGNYTFKVIACNNDGIWNEEGASVEVQLLPAWWNTWVFRIFMVIVILSVIVSIYFYRVSYLKKRHILLEKIVEERTREIYEKNRLLQSQTQELNISNSRLAKRTEELEEQSIILNETNALMEERQQQVEEQAEELLVQKEELEKVNIHLNELNLTKDKFFSIIAHDLKNPFSTVLGFSELLVDRFDNLNGEKIKKYLEMIFVASQNVYALLQNLLEWARTQTDSVKINPERIKLQDVVDDNIHLVSETARKKRIPIVCSHNNANEIFADKNMVDTIVRNLLMNAIKFSEPEKEVNILILDNPDFVQLEVKDNGIGIPKDKLGHLFKIDANVSREGTQGETGTGLGLILCKEYIDKIHGKMWVESEENKGTSFYVSFPVYKENAS